MERRRIVTNTSDRMMLVFTEPEGQDYWLRPAESVELRAAADSPAADFEICDHSDGVTIWPSDGLGYISVWAGGVEPFCGHQQPPGWA